MFRIKLLKALLFAILFSGCAQPSSSTPYTPPTLEKEWSVKMTLSGGIAGLMRNIEVRSDGSYTVVDERANTSVDGMLAGDELAQLEEMISILEVSAARNPSTCADCFVYDIEILSGGQKMIVSADDVTLGDSGIATLAQFLREIMDSALK